MSSSTQRLQQIAVMYAKHEGELRRVVHRRASSNHAIVEDACAHAWTQLLLCEDVDVRAPRWTALAWLTTTAIRHAWQLGSTQHRAAPMALDALDTLTQARGDTQPGADEISALRGRLDLIAQLPERPRRFLLRLALGYSYAEISQTENTTPRTTDRQIARAKRLLRDLQHAQHTHDPQP